MTDEAKPEVAWADCSTIWGLFTHLEIDSLTENFLPTVRSFAGTLIGLVAVGAKALA